MSLALFLLAVALQGAQAPRDAVTVERYLTLSRLESVRVAPDGRAVAFLRRSADLAANVYRSELHIWHGGRTDLIDPAASDARSPGWSRDGDWISCLRGDSSAQIWVVPRVLGGSSIQLGPIPGSVLEYDWGSANRLYALTRGGNRAAYEIWALPAPEGAAEYVWGSNRELRDLTVSPDGSAIAFSVNSASTAGQASYDLSVLDLGARTVRSLTNRPGSELAPVWSPDGKAIVFRAPKRPGDPRSQTGLFTVPSGGGSPEILTESFDRSVLDHRWPASADLIFLAALGTYTHVFALRPTGAIEPLTSGEYNYSALDVGPGGSPIYTVRESANEAPELWRLNGSESGALTRFHPQTGSWALSRQQRVRWVAPDGLSIEGLLIYPADYRQGNRYPLLVNPRGGAADRLRDVLLDTHAYQVLAAQGYAVLAAGFRGSMGYGEAFATAQRDDLAGGELADVLAGIEHLIRVGIADSTRIAIFGDGYGARVASDAVRRTPRFLATAIATGKMSPFADGLDPGVPPVLQIQGSDLAGLRNAPTPVLFVQGAAVSNLSLQPIYEQLRAQGRRVDYFQLPSEVAELTPRHATRVFFRQLRWFDRYLKLGGADLLDFYLVDEWVPGPHGWQLRISHVTSREQYAALPAEAGRLVELTLEIQPEPANRRSAGDLRLDLENGVQLRLGSTGAVQPFVGTVTELFGRETLVLGPPGAVSVPAPRRGAPSALSVRMAFSAVHEAAEYWLEVAGFRPVRIWLAGDD